MRRLPVFFVLDCSESMVGANLQKMEECLQVVTRALRTDPYALETVYVSVIAFAGTTRTIAPLVEVVSFYPPKLPLGSGTSLGTALDALMTEIDRNVVKTTPDAKGDWKPIVYLITDGHPTDDPGPAIERWNAKYARKTTLVAIGLGKNADFTVLKRLTENVIVYEESKEGDFQKFVKWISASVVAQSKSVGEGVDSDTLPTLDESVMRIVKEPPPVADESCVTLVGRCQKTRRPYLIKYEREVQAVATRDFRVDVTQYHLAGCHPLEEDYFAWSDMRATEFKVNTASLVGSPGCPHCGNITAFAVCSCGKLLCVNGPGEVTCPWCKQQVSFGTEASDAFDVGRSRG
ncbi:MAG: VWA domain-containing protein [Zoogloeaceae bacterium]|jgi:uncharacterized protein YegL|nr:VWA domain-containing protein [Zoogloeaceae bacterium]